MFAKTIVLSDAFLDMPLSTRCLYFTLGMLADDDGFVNSPKGIMRQVGASIDDLNLLAAKKFIIAFESGVIVIKHWRLHNYIQKDRYKGTKYLDEKDSLAVDERGVYTKCIQSVSKMDTQDRLEVELELGESKERIDYQHIADMYNDICISFPRLTVLSDKRKKAIKARLNSYTVEQFKTLFEKAEMSNFLKGANSRNWQANFDWLIKDSNFAKVIDGNYDNMQKNQQQGTGNMFLDMLKEGD